MDRVDYLAEVIGKMPALLFPCIKGRGIDMFPIA